ncbi:MAG: murein hydrolase activator EnvC family protein [Paludibacter sp.]
MKSNKVQIKSFLQKLSFQYRVSVLNENTLEESWHIRLSRLSVLVYASSLVFATFILLTLLIFATPIRYYLPGYGESGDRSNIINESMFTDSLLHDAKLQTGYLNMIRSIIDGKIKPDSIAELDSVKLKELARDFVEKTDNEKEFVKEFEDKEKYNLATIEQNYNENVFVFFRPTKGVISSTFDMAEKQYGISMITSVGETVQSVLAGTVIYAGFTFDFGYVIQIQHENNYISIYKNNSRLLKKVGDNIRAGEGIAITGDEASAKAGNQFYFELWQMGKPVNPEDVIIF